MRQMDASSCNEKPPGYRFPCHRSSYCGHNNTFRGIFSRLLEAIGLIEWDILGFWILGEPLRR
ncbi:hypothetical protein BJX65DRAFT_271459 [Aspergillus insuetus]